MTRLMIIAALLALAGCASRPACDRYGFVRGTTAYAQCVQAETLAIQQRTAIMLAK